MNDRPGRRYSRIAHISDPHISRKYYREHIKSLKKLLQSILEDGVDHIVITGDIVSTADAGDYYLAREIFRSFGILDASSLTVIPGNHDIFGGPHRATDILSFPDTIRSIDYHRHLDLFFGAFAETFVGVRHLSGSDPFPFIKRVGCSSLVALNSVPKWSIRKNPLGTNGMLDDEQEEALKRIAGIPHDGTTRIALLHHHLHDLVADGATRNSLWTRIESGSMRMRRRRRLLRLLKTAGIRIALHGHIHRNEVYKRDDLTCANGAGAVCDDPISQLKYNLLSVAEGGFDIRQRLLPHRYAVSTVDVAFHEFRKPFVRPAFVLHSP